MFVTETISAKTMNKQDSGILQGVIHKLSRLSHLEHDDRHAIEALPYRIAGTLAGDLLIREGDSLHECCLLVAGYACRFKTSGNGGRQIVSFHLAGDILDLQHLLFKSADHSVQTITPATIAWVPREALLSLARERPAIGEAFWRDTLIEASVFREWVLNLGRRDARSRIAHMLCEFVTRGEAVGLGTSERFRLPMTQEYIADATGLTAVHVNRMMRQLRDEGVVDFDRREMRIADWERMREIADYHPAYLHVP